MKRSTVNTSVHLIGWILFLSLPVIFLGRNWDIENVVSFFFSIEYWEYFLFYCLLFYFNIFWLLPKLYFAGKKVWYFLIIAALFIVTLFVQPFDRLVGRRELTEGRFPGPEIQQRQAVDLNQPPPEPPLGPGGFDEGKPPPVINGGPKKTHIDIVSIFLYLLIVILGILLESSRQLLRSQEKLLQAEAEKAHAELSFLKAQINPHFLFNTLNNIYSMSLAEHEETPSAILKLSGIMRYVTDEVNSNFVSLADEITCIENYIYLQKLRLGKKVQVYFSVAGQQENQKIAPLILMTFVENVFKHGISSQETSPININISIDYSGLVFTTKNKMFHHHSPEERTGVGIENTKKRLQLLYSGRHSLSIERTGGYFQVFLNLQFK